MIKTLRIGFMVIAVLVIGLVVAAAVFVYTADYNRHKGLIEKAVMDATGRQLVIKGDLAVIMSLPPELAVDDVKLANAPWVHNCRWRISGGSGCVSGLSRC